MTSSLRLLIARHGESTGNVAGVVQGAGLESTLTQLGKEQAAKLRLRLECAEIDQVFSSDLPRAALTALLALPGRRAELRAELRERSAGVLEGQPLGAVEAAAAASRQRVRFFRPPGGESWADVRERATRFLLQELLLDTEQQSRTVLVVSHGGFIRELVAAALALGASSLQLPRGRVGNTSLTTLLLLKTDGVWRCSELLWNDTCDP